MPFLGVELPIIQAPMAGVQGSALAVAVSNAGGLGSLPCAMLTHDAIRDEIMRIRARTERPFNLNFFCHRPPEPDAARDRQWRSRLAGYYAEFDVQPPVGDLGGARRPFDEDSVALVEHFRPAVVSFHFGLPRPDLLARVKASGATILSSATTVAEARWLEDNGADAVIAQGLEAGGHRGTFLESSGMEQKGMQVLVPQIRDAVRLPVIAAGGIADARSVAAALALGAAAVQVGTTYLLCPEATTSPLHREALRNAGHGSTVVTNVLTGKPARGLMNRVIRELGPMNDAVPAFPLAAAYMAPLRAAAEARGRSDFSPLWCGENATGYRNVPAAELTRLLSEHA